jgi:hypothetical protein
MLELSQGGGLNFRRPTAYNYPAARAGEKARLKHGCRLSEMRLACGGRFMMTSSIFDRYSVDPFACDRVSWYLAVFYRLFEKVSAARAQARVFSFYLEYNLSCYFSYVPFASTLLIDSYLNSAVCCAGLWFPSYESPTLNQDVFRRNRQKTSSVTWTVNKVYVYVVVSVQRIQAKLITSPATISKIFLVCDSMTRLLACLLSLSL